MPSTSYTPAVTAGLALAVRPPTSGGGEIAGDTQVTRLLGPLTSRTPAFFSDEAIAVSLIADTVEGPLGDGRAWIYRKAGPMVPAVRPTVLLDVGYDGSGGGSGTESKALTVGFFGPIAPRPMTGLEISMPVAPTGGGLGDGEALRRARSGPQTPTVQTTTLLDVSFDISGGAKPRVETGAFIAQRSRPFTPMPVTTAMIDAAYVATGGAKTAETDAVVRQLTGPKTPMPMSGGALDQATEFTGGCWSRGSARWQMANYPTEAVIGGAIAGGGARIVTEITSRTITRDPITIYAGGGDDGGGGGGGGGGNQGRQADQSITLSIGGSSGGGDGLNPEDETTGGGEEPIILGEYLVENADMKGTGGAQAIGTITYLGGEITYVILPGGPSPGGGQLPPHVTIDITGNYGTSASSSGGGTGIVSFVDPNYPGLGGGSGEAGDLNITIPSGLFNLNGASLADFLTINDHTQGGMPGGIYDPNPAPGAAGAIFGNRGLHANLLSMTCSIDAEVDLTGLRAQLTLLTSSIDVFDTVIGTISASTTAITCSIDAIQGVLGTISADTTRLTSSINAIQGVRGTISASTTKLTSSINAIAGVRGSIDARLTRLSSTIGVLTNITGPIEAKLPLIVGSIDDAAVSYARIASRLTRIEGSITVAVSGVIAAPLRPLNGVLTPGVAARLGAQLPLLTATLKDDTITAALPLMQGTLVVAADIRASLTLLRSHFGFQPDYGTVQGVMVTNTQTTAITTYEDYPFNSYCEVNGVYFGTSDAGLCQIDTGTDDSGQPISAGICTGMVIFNDVMQKRTFDTFATMRSSGGLTLTIHVEEAARHAPVNVPMIPRASAGLVKYRGILPKGLRGKTWQFELNNVAGSAFEFNDLSILEVPATRRI